MKREGSVKRSDSIGKKTEKRSESVGKKSEARTERRPETEGKRGANQKRSDSVSK